MMAYKPAGKPPTSTGRVQELSGIVSFSMYSELLQTYTDWPLYQKHLLFCIDTTKPLLPRYLWVGQSETLTYYFIFTHWTLTALELSET